MVERNGVGRESTLDEFKKELFFRSRGMYSTQLRRVSTDLIKSIVSEAQGMTKPFLVTIYAQDLQTGEMVLSGYTVEEKAKEKVLA